MRKNYCEEAIEKMTNAFKSISYNFVKEITEDKNG